MKNKLDYLIVGQGLAGSILAFTAILNNKNIGVIASKNYVPSSAVAGGIINSVVIKRLTKSWRADEFNNYLKQFYPKWENDLKSKFFLKTKTFKLISSKEEEGFWISRRIENKMQEYLSEEFHSNKIPSSFKCMKTAEIYQTYFLDFNILLNKFKKRLINDNLLFNEDFDHSKIKFNEDSVSYKNLKAKCIIFCEGVHSVKNPYFNWLPFSLNKGEILTIKSSEIKLEQVINKKIFILPIGNDLYKIGSSYEWDNLDNQPTEEKKKEILENFEQMCPVKYEVVEHVAGIRPASRDRRPFLGQHPENKNLYIFNGMGAKAALMAPLLAKELLEFIEENKTLNKESSIERYEKLYKIDSLK